MEAMVEAKDKAVFVATDPVTTSEINVINVTAGRSNSPATQLMLMASLRLPRRDLDFSGSPTKILNNAKKMSLYLPISPASMDSDLEFGSKGLHATVPVAPK